MGVEKKLNLFSVLKVTALAFLAVMWIKQVPVLIGVRCRLSQQGRWLSGPELAVWLAARMWVGSDFHMSESEAYE